jgi:hypothetical protein
MQIKIRDPKSGQWKKGPNTKSTKVFKDLGNVIVNQGKKRLGNSNKTIKRDFSYKFVETKNAMELQFNFGKAEDYWKYIDQGVQGKGGYKGSGSARGRGSKFKFKYDNPSGKLVTALESWIKSKSIPLKDGMNITSTAFAMGYAVKRRGLKRTLFFTEPFEKNIDKFMKKTVKAFADDVEKVWNKVNIGEIKVKQGL